MHDDARTNIAIALTAAEKGAAVANYCEVTSLLKDAGGLPAYGNSQELWSDGMRFGSPDPKHRS